MMHIIHYNYIGQIIFEYIYIYIYIHIYIYFKLYKHSKYNDVTKLLYHNDCWGSV